MKILVLNCGSSSLKYQLIDMENESVLASGKYERIGEKEAFINIKVNGEKKTIEGMNFTVIGTPGHTKGSCCFYFEEDKILVSGDTLFEGSVGRTDFPTGNSSQLIASLKNKLMCLPDEVRVFPGHGGSTTIGDEKRYNPFCM